MENRNNALHYKMYKSGKNIVYAGLATTAVLAGLTLANANNTADASTLVSATTTEQTAATSAATPATSAEIASQQSVVNSVSANVASQQAVVNANSAAVASAAAQNSAYAAVSAARVANDNAQKDYYAASNATNSAWSAAHSANKAVSEAQAYADAWQANNGALQSAYNRLNNDLTSAQKDLNDAQAQSAALSDAVNVASDALKKAENDSSISVDTLVQLRDNLDDAKRAYKRNQNLINTAQNHINFTNDVLAGKKTHSWSAPLTNNSSYNYNYAKSEVDALPSLKATADKLNQAFKDAKKAQENAGQIATDKYNALQQAALDNKLPLDANMLKEWRKNAAGAQTKINEDKAAQLYNVKVKDGNNLVSVNDINKNINWGNEALSDAQKEVEKRNGNVSKAQANVDAQAKVVAEQQKKVDSLQAEFDKDTTNKAIKSQLDIAKDRLDTENIILSGYKAQLKKQQGRLNKAEANVQAKKDYLTYWNGKLAEAKSTPEYQKLQADIAYRQSIVDLGNQGLDNFNSAKDAAAKLAPLKAAYDESVKTLKAYEDQLAAAKAKLAAMQGTTNPDQPANPGQNNGGNGNNQGNNGNNQGNNGNNQGNNGNTTNNNGSATNNQGNTNSGVANNFTGIKGNKYYVNGLEVTKKAYEDHVAAAAKVSANAAKTNANNAAALPQTGNENNAAVVALGAVSAMFGLGLAAKKREF